jgi:hypothetical protein
MCRAMRPNAQTESAAALSQHAPMRPTERARLCRWVHAAICAEVNWAATVGVQDHLIGHRRVEVDHLPVGTQVSKNAGRPLTTSEATCEGAPEAWRAARRCCADVGPVSRFLCHLENPERDTSQFTHPLEASSKTQGPNVIRRSHGADALALRAHQHQAGHRLHRGAHHGDRRPPGACHGIEATGCRGKYLGVHFLSSRIRQGRRGLGPH